MFNMFLLYVLGLLGFVDLSKHTKMSTKVAWITALFVVGIAAGFLLSALAWALVIIITNAVVSAARELGFLAEAGWFFLTLNV